MTREALKYYLWLASQDAYLPLDVLAQLDVNGYLLPNEDDSDGTDGDD